MFARQYGHVPFSQVEDLIRDIAKRRNTSIKETNKKVMRQLELSGNNYNKWKERDWVSVTNYMGLLALYYEAGRNNSRGNVDVVDTYQAQQDQVIVIPEPDLPSPETSVVDAMLDLVKANPSSAEAAALIIQADMNRKTA
jgi:hypothetical protein